MANPERDEVEIELCGQRLILRPDFAAQAETEERTGKAMLELLRLVATGRVKTTDLAVVLWASARRTGRKVRSLEEVGNLLIDEGLTPRVLESVGKLLTRAVGGIRDAAPGEEAPEVNPPPPAAE